MNSYTQDGEREKQKIEINPIKNIPIFKKYKYKNIIQILFDFNKC